MSVTVLIGAGVGLMVRGGVRRGVLLFYLAYIVTLVYVTYRGHLDLSSPTTLSAFVIPTAVIVLGFLLLRTQERLDAALAGVGHEVATLLTDPVRQARRLIVLVVGATVVLFGVVLLVIPGPGLLFMVIGFGILATEFYWAQQLLKRLQREVRTAAAKLRSQPGGGDDAG